MTVRVRFAPSPTGYVHIGDKCHFCDRDANHMVYVAKAY